MGIVVFIINILKTIVAVIYPPFKKKYFDQPKISIKLTGNNSSVGSAEFAKDELDQDPENRIQNVYASRSVQLEFMNYSEYTAYNLKLLTQLVPQFIIKPGIDVDKPLPINTKIDYALVEFNYNFKRRERETKSEYPDPPEIANLKLILEYTNVKGTKFYTIFDNSLDEQNKNTFQRKNTES